jgi:hypothetical protein
LKGSTVNTVSTRGLWLACALLLSIIVGAASGVLTLMAGAHPAVAVVAAGAGFAATTQLLIKIMTFVNAQSGANPDPPSSGPTT